MNTNGTISCDPLSIHFTRSHKHTIRLLRLWGAWASLLFFL